MSDSVSGHLDTPLSSYSSPLMSHYPNPHLASTKSQGLHSMLGSTTSQNHRQQSQHLATTRRVSPDIFAAISDIMRVLVTNQELQLYFQNAGLKLLPREPDYSFFSLAVSQHFSTPERHGGGGRTGRGRRG